MNEMFDMAGMQLPQFLGTSKADEAAPAQPEAPKAPEAPGAAEGARGGRGAVSDPIQPPPEPCSGGGFLPCPPARSKNLGCLRRRDGVN